MANDSSTSVEFLSIASDIFRDKLLSDTADLRFYSEDFSEEYADIALAVFRPESTDDVVQLIRLAAKHDISVVARGGGMSYTKSHMPQNRRTVVIDTSTLASIIKIDVENRYVVVEPGVTWNKLRQALADTGYRVPYLGTLSGMIATVGGGASQNATGMGRMTLAEHILGLEVVLGNGDVVMTGSSITKNTLPFYRYNGPDLTGLFLCDSGAFGIKTKIVLYLEPIPCVAFGCVAFESRTKLVEAQSEMAKTNFHTEAFAFDEYFVEQYAKHPRPSRAEIKEMLRSYWAAPGNKSLLGLIKLYRSWHPKGLGYLSGKGTVMYYTAEGHDQCAANRARRKIDRIMRKHGGKLIPTSIPFALRHGPFLNIADMMTNSAGEVNYPINAKLAVSQAESAMKIYLEFVQEHKIEMERLGVRMACNTLLHGHFFGIEPVVFWKKPLSHYRRSFASDSAKRASDQVRDNDESTAFAISLRYKLAQRFRELGALHVQWGRVYGYSEAIERAGTKSFLRGIKQLVDPHQVINPGVLGL